MARYMRNRSGVVSYLDAGLLGNEMLGFKTCDINGKDLPTASGPVAEAPAPVTATTRKSSRKKGR